MPKIYNKVTGGVNEQNLILGARESFTYPFDSTDWKDLRGGAFLSLTKTSGGTTPDDDPTGLAETITNPNVMPPQDRCWIGFKTSDGNLPTNAGTLFIGFSNSAAISHQDPGDSVLLSSDIGIGTATNQYYWRIKNSINSIATFAVFDGTTRLGVLNTGFPHFPQVPASAGGYATFIGIQLLRASSTSKQVTAKVYKSGNSSDMLFSNTPTGDLVISTLDQWTITLVQSSQMTLSAVPDALFFYSPFHNSRLRIHACGVLRAL
jgi:hypothetical protein